MNDNDPINHPKHYTMHPSGIECIDVAEHLPFNVGNALKYLWRAKYKGREQEDLQKCLWYLERETRFTKLVYRPFGASRFITQKVIDKEGESSTLGKFLEEILNSSLSSISLSKLIKIVTEALPKESEVR